MTLVHTCLIKQILGVAQNRTQSRGQWENPNVTLSIYLKSLSFDCISHMMKYFSTIHKTSLRLLRIIDSFFSKENIEL
jgi:hypothetical protein